ncbi:hypothetical protein RDI58_020126 [Solanum bulbocastanum]|uniref:Uncharacterized protein n=1 Tax=Solanum bulbocastanum TaxID=147425 RepID=A0AAN8T616_SOLBU
MILWKLHQFNDNISERKETTPNVEENAPHPSRNQPHPEIDQFEQLLRDSNEELYPGCKNFSKLSFVLQLYCIKWSNESFNTLLGLLKDALPKDSEAWKAFDIRHSEFAKDPRNVWLGLSSDGLNPFGTMRNVYSTWPMILVPYNLPPWLCMKEEFFILSLLIPGQKGPKNNIDVFLEPLIEELNDLWSVGTETIDSFSNETFQLRVALM